jgi:hypothetical protein
MGQSRIDNPETLAELGTQDTNMWIRPILIHNEFENLFLWNYFAILNTFDLDSS